MHMADALISPAVGGMMWATTAGVAAHAAKKLQKDLDDSKVPLMGVLGAFVFAAQMVNFAIPGTGSSGHLGGGLLLAILLGPHAAFLTMASILTIQALFFADGGLLALGANIFNLGFFPCYIAYPFIYKKIVGANPGKGRHVAGAMAAAVIGLQLGAFAVVLETVFSGISALPFASFVLLMQPIHLAIGLVEGLITTAVILFIAKERPEILQKAVRVQPLSNVSLKPLLIAILAAAVVTGGILSWFASADPDGLEWSILKATGQEELAAPQGTIHSVLAEWQQKIAVFPDYNVKEAGNVSDSAKVESSWPAVDRGTSLAGVAGSVLTLLLAALFGKGLQLAAGRRKQEC